MEKGSDRRTGFDSSAGTHCGREMLGLLSGYNRSSRGRGFSVWRGRPDSDAWILLPASRGLIEFRAISGHFPEKIPVLASSSGMHIHDWINIFENLREKGFPLQCAPAIMAALELLWPILRLPRSGPGMLIEKTGGRCGAGTDTHWSRVLR